jgi:hypothetical protein
VLTDLFDVVMLNRYYGWYVSPGDLATAERALEAEISAWVAAYDKPIVFTDASSIASTRRQQEGRLHPRAATEGDRAPAAPPLACGLVTNIASVTVAVCGTVTAGVVISLPATATPGFPRSRPRCLVQVNGGSP